MQIWSTFYLVTSLISWNLNLKAAVFYHFPLYLEFKEDSISEYIKVNNSSAFMILNAKAVYINPSHWEILCFIQNVISSRISGELQIWTTKMFLKTPFCLVLYSTLKHYVLFSTLSSLHLVCWYFSNDLYFLLISMYF